ncbi:MAG TPA: hypothetical protein RMH85_15860 [Polyangiaceae bacterium LLY-WYZ-15_(1-7)]|nr:hypothetical protein [Myxococcales bacterium]MAT29871.1 hypothetical protein [Sandaracinus sp.]HJL01125.1 hypothetical protein [Polyangiaceae bacterium LLY-WYZ-15_(1-7)]MBJ73609.1 hypothetical protein [Sandaracinus sp.]HJL09976.1 hypothetical protein [Polyangiaceae bacterium LLY-WYZ-15_(1-7)]
MAWRRAAFIGILAGLGLLACGDDDGAPGADAGEGGDVDAAAATDASSTDAAPAGDAAPGGDDAGSAGGTLAERYPGDEGIGDDPAVLFHDDFEAGWGRWDAPSADTRYLTLLGDGAEAHAGSGYLRARVSRADLEEDMYISAAARVGFERVETIHWRFHARFPRVAPNPHHWVRVAAGNADWERSGLANTVPAGDEGFWFDLDANDRNELNFYAYWHQMRSGRCNDGSATPGCEGDQGTTYHYGNVFRPPQEPFPRDEWVCVEMAAGANSVGASDGWLRFWVDDALVGDFRPGHPEGTWLRDRFHPGGCEFSACTEPVPFEGFDFRTSDEVGFKAVILDAYFERDSSARRRERMRERGLEVEDVQEVLYDDVVVATERIGCRR